MPGGILEPWKSLQEDFSENASALIALYYAQRGDWDALAQHIEGGGKITSEVREFLASVLRGDVTKPKKRPTTQRMFRRHMEISIYIAWKRRRGIKNATQLAAAKFNMDHRAVQRVFNTYGKAAASSIADFEGLWAKVGGDPEVFEEVYATYHPGIK